MTRDDDDLSAFQRFGIWSVRMITARDDLHNATIRRRNVAMSQTKDPRLSKHAAIIIATSTQNYRLKSSPQKREPPLRFAIEQESQTISSAVASDKPQIPAIRAITQRLQNHDDPGNAQHQQPTSVIVPS